LEHSLSLSFVISDKQPVELELVGNSAAMEPMHGKKAVKPSHEENNKAKDRSMIDEFQHPPSKSLVSRSGDLDLDSYPQMVKKVWFPITFMVFSLFLFYFINFYGS
jgi:hypothetical protein